MEPLQEYGWFHPSRGYWQTIGRPHEDILAGYPDGTLEVPLKPGEHYVLQDGLWVYVEPPPVYPPLRKLDFWLAAAAGGVAIDKVRATIAAMTDPVERATAQAFVEFADVYRRDDPLLIAMAEAEGITSSQLDTLWLWAAQNAA